MTTPTLKFSNWVFLFGFLLSGFSLPALAKDLKVMITPEMGSFKVLHEGRKIKVMRNQNPKNRIADYLAVTARECPPHCVQPMRLPGIETVGELEVIDYLKKISAGDDSILVVDTRAPNHVAKGTLPGSVNIFGDDLIEDRGANPITIEEIMTQQFGASGSDGRYNFSKAKTLVLFCYGIWCGQGPRTARALVKLGYPKKKLKWYRGGIQAWESLGLTTVRR